MQEQNITIYKLENLSGVYSSTIAMFFNKKDKNNKTRKFIVYM